MALTRPTSTTSTSADDPGGVSLAGLFDEYADAIEALGTPGVDYPTKATVTLSSAQILDLHNTPVTLVPAPGAGKYVNVHRYAFDYAYGTTPYVVGDAFYMAYGADVASVADLYDDIGAANSLHVQRTPTVSIVGTSADLDNLPVVLSAAGVAITDGDGDIPAFTVWYTVEDVPA